MFTVECKGCLRVISAASGCESEVIHWHVLIIQIRIQILIAIVATPKHILYKPASPRPIQASANVRTRSIGGRQCQDQSVSLPACCVPSPGGRAALAERLGRHTGGGGCERRGDGGGE